MAMCESSEVFSLSTRLFTLSLTYLNMINMDFEIGFFGNKAVALDAFERMYPSKLVHMPIQATDIFNSTFLSHL